MSEFNICVLETPEEMARVEELQRRVWTGSETDVVPMHLLITAVHNGGLILGAFQNEELIGFIFGFPGFEQTPDGPRLKHCSHMLGIHPNFRDGGVGFALKRAQWQMLRHQGLDHATWTFDPLMSRNAYLNLAKLGAVCSTYRRSEYGEMRDGLNAGLPSDRFQVDWWLNTHRVKKRLGADSRATLNLKHIARSGLKLLYPLHYPTDSLPRPPEQIPPFERRLLLAEIPADFADLKSKDFALARDWRFFVREFFETAFEKKFIVTDFIFDHSVDDRRARGLYLLTHGESTLDQFE